MRLRNTVHAVDRTIAAGATESFDLGVRGTSPTSRRAVAFR